MKRERVTIKNTLSNGEPVEMIGYKVTEHLAIARRSSSWAVFSIATNQALIGYITRKADAAVLAVKIEGLSKHYNVPLTLPLGEGALNALESNLAGFMERLKELNQRRNRQYAAPDAGELALREIVGEFEDGEVIFYLLDEDKAADDPKRWERVTPSELAEELEGIRLGRSIAFAVLESDDDYEEDDAILLWAQDEKNAREARDFLNIYREKRLYHAYDYVANWASADGWLNGETPMTPAEREGWITRRSNATMSYIAARDAYQARSQWLRGVMQEKAFVEAGWVDGMSIFAYRTWVIAQIEGALSHWNDLDQLLASWMRAMVYRVGRNWEGNLVEEDRDGMGGIYYAYGRKDSESDLLSALDDLTSDSKIPASPEAAYFDTFAG